MNQPDKYNRLYSGYEPIRHLPGDTVVLAEYDITGIQDYPSMRFAVQPGRAVEADCGEDLRHMIGYAQARFPGRCIDVSVTRETFKAGRPECFGTHRLGIHTDGFSFFVISSDEPTVFYGPDRTISEQARPGELVYVLGDTKHSSPNPDHDGERVRIKLIPIFMNMPDRRSQYLLRAAASFS